MPSPGGQLARLQMLLNPSPEVFSPRGWLDTHREVEEEGPEEDHLQEDNSRRPDPLQGQRRKGAAGSLGQRPEGMEPGQGDPPRTRRAVTSFPLL